MGKIQINSPAWKKVLIEKFWDLPYIKDRHVITYGSRGSGKSFSIGEILIDRCLVWKNFNCLVIRKEVNKHPDSTFKLLKQTISINNLDGLFKCTTNPLKIKCVNGNEFIFRGMDDIDNIKSLVDIAACWFEEEIPDNENDFETVALTIRSNKVPYLQFFYSINPTIPDHENHWFWQRWFKDTKDLSFRKELTMINDRGEQISEWGTILHSTYLDNKYLDKGTYNSLQLLKMKDPYTYATQALGIWSAKVPKGKFWKCFDLTKHTIIKNEYNPDIPLHFSFDFNKNPGMHVGIYQIENKIIKQIFELSLVNPNNRTTDACNHLNRKYINHKSGVYIYGDPNGYKEDSSTEKGFNNFAIIFEMLAQFKPHNRTTRKAPPVMKSAEWIDEILFCNLDGLSIMIGEDCRESLADFIYTQEDSEGGVLKTGSNKLKDDEGKSYEKYGHFSDLFRYFMTQCYSSEFERYRTPMAYKPKLLPRINKNKY